MRARQRGLAPNSLDEMTAVVIEAVTAIGLAIAPSVFDE